MGYGKIIAGFLVVGASLPSTANAQTQQTQQMCMTRAKIMDYVLTKYDESPVYVASMGEDGVLMTEFTISPNGSWSMIGTSPEGTSCIMAGGRNWEQSGEIKLPGVDS